MSYLLDIPGSRYLFYIYTLYPTPTFCLQKWVESGGWCSKSVLLRLVSVCLVSSVWQSLSWFLISPDTELSGMKCPHCIISWMPKPAAAHVRDLPMCVLAALPVTRIVPVGKALVRHIWLSVSSGGSGHKSVPVHAKKSLCEQDGCLYAHIKTFVPRTSKRAASGPVPRSSYSQLKIHLHCRVGFEICRQKMH